MRFSTIITALAFVFSINAAAVSKRDVATCLTDLTAITTQLPVVTNMFDTYNASEGLRGFLYIQYNESALETMISNAYASSACCIGSVVSETDANSIIAAVDPLTTNMIAILDTTIAKKSVFDSAALITGLVKGDIFTLNNRTNTLSACLLASTPADLTATAQGYVDQINAAFAAAVAAYA